MDTKDRETPSSPPKGAVSWSPSGRRMLFVFLASFVLLVVLVGAVLAVLLSGIWMRNLDATSDGDEVIRIQGEGRPRPNDVEARDAD